MTFESWFFVGAFSTFVLEGLLGRYEILKERHDEKVIEDFLIDEMLTEHEERKQRKANK